MVIAVVQKHWFNFECGRKARLCNEICYKPKVEVGNREVDSIVYNNFSKGIT